MTDVASEVYVDAPRQFVWELTNDVRQWPELFTEYASVEILDQGPPIRFRLTTVPDNDGKVWSWVSERTPDRETYTVTAQRIETGPFEFMNLRWTYLEDGEGTRMRWEQDFHMKATAPFDDAAMHERLSKALPVQMDAVSRSVAERYHHAVQPAHGDVGIHTDEHARRLLLLTCGRRLSTLVEAVVELEIPRLIGEDGKTVQDLAAAAKVHAEPLYRALRALATVGIFSERTPHRFTNTSLSRFLIEDHPYSLAPLVRHSCSTIVTAPQERLLEALRTGVSTANTALGGSVWEFLDAHPEDARAFDAAMTRLGAWEIENHVAAIDPARFATVIDLGGGHGRFLAACLTAAPATHGVLVDTARVLRHATDLLSRFHVTDRVNLLSTDAFELEPVTPKPNTGVVMKAVLHNWDDQRAQRLLTVATNLIDSTGRVFIIEQVVAGGDHWDHAKWLDLDMMLTFGGRERSATQWRDLLDSVGMVPVSVPPEGRWGVIEARLKES